MRRLSLGATIAMTFVGVIGLQAANVAWAAGGTQVVNVVAVGRNGQPANGYHVINRQPSPNLSACPGPSPAAVSRNVYACDPEEAAAEVCWPAPASVLCLEDPWSKALRRFPVPGALPAVEPPSAPIPFALQLDDGTPCVLPNGFDLGGRADEQLPVYGCGTQKSSQAVLVPGDQDPSAAIDRSNPMWTVRVGQLGPPLTPLGFLVQHNVKTAWFAA